ncbi:MAG TPA: hypothetical protein VK910_07095 [Thiobacillus sp.]|nr:hypothetical protein [Thiobacillus sp.]
MKRRVLRVPNPGLQWDLDALEDLPPETGAGEGGRSRRPRWWRNWKIMLPLWIGIGGLVWLGVHFNVDHSVIAGSVVLIGLVSHAFAWLLGIIALVPVIGPIIAKVLSVGFIWLLNAIGYLVAYVAIRRGYSKDVLTYRGLTIAVIVGIVIGFVLGKLI